MAIKNKDGTVYKLTCPNPLMQEQDIWSADVIFHNHFGIKVCIPDPARKPIIKEEVVKELPQVVVEPSFMADIWCLPAIYEEVVDPLYGEKHKRINYGNKFVFKAKLMEMSDLFIILWTENQEVTEGSIIFPQVKDKRWWRVAEIKDNLLRCVITDYQPNFSL